MDQNICIWNTKSLQKITEIPLSHPQEVLLLVPLSFSLPPFSSLSEGGRGKEERKKEGSLYEELEGYFFIFIFYFYFLLLLFIPFFFN